MSQSDSLQMSSSVDRITLALQTAARLSKQAELGGILEEIEVSS